MKFAREATTKNGRRTWKVTYELVRGPEPKPKGKSQPKADKPASREPARAVEKKTVEKKPPAKSSTKKSQPRQTRDKKKRAKGDDSQLRIF